MSTTTSPDLSYERAPSLDHRSRRPTYPGRVAGRLSVRVAAYVAAGRTHWLNHVGDEMYVATFREDLARSASLTNAANCDTLRNSLSNVLLSLRGNSSQKPHFDAMTTAPGHYAYLRTVPYTIVRIDDHLREIAGHGIADAPSRTSTPATT